MIGISQAQSPVSKKCIESYARLSYRIDLDPRILCNV